VFGHLNVNLVSPHSLVSFPKGRDPPEHIPFQVDDEMVFPLRLLSDKGNLELFGSLAKLPREIIVSPQYIAIPFTWRD